MTETLESGQVVPLPFENSPAKISDFITSYGRREALELSFLDAPFTDSSDIDGESFALALRNAHELIQSYKVRASLVGSAAIAEIEQRAQLVIARHYLDVVRRRSEVRADFEDIVALLEDIVDGRSTDSEADSASTLRGESAVSFTVQPRVFTRSKLEGYRLR